MNLIVDQPPRTFWLQVIDDIAGFEPPFAGTAYPCLVWDTKGHRQPDELRQLSTALIASNCRYGVCGGMDCERWHDALDAAYLAQDLSEREAEAKFVMTSWHTEEPLNEVTFFLVHNTNFEDHDFKQFLILQLGSDWTTQEALSEAVREHVAAPDEDDEDEGENWSGDAA
jgi:hypothetical protein